MAGLQEVWGGKGTSQAEVLADHLGMYSAFAVPNREQPVALLATLDHPAGPLHMRASCVEWEPEFADEHLAQTRALAVLLVDPGLDDPCRSCSPPTSTPRRTAPKCGRSPTSWSTAGSLAEATRTRSR